MYEVGLALACRHSAEVLLVRDDTHKFLFDVSTVPHKHIDFSNPTAAKEVLQQELTRRLTERDHVLDARLLTSVAQLTAAEKNILQTFSHYGPDRTFWLTKTGLVHQSPVARLLDKQLIVTVGSTKDGHATFKWTRLGYMLARNLDKLLPTLSEMADSEPGTGGTT